MAAGKCLGSGNSRFGNDLQAVAETEARSERAPKHAIFDAQPVTRDGPLTKTLRICRWLPNGGLTLFQDSHRKQAVGRQGNAREQPFSSNGSLVALNVRRSIAVTHPVAG